MPFKLFQLNRAKWIHFTERNYSTETAVCKMWSRRGLMNCSFDVEMNLRFFCSHLYYYRDMPASLKHYDHRQMCYINISLVQCSISDSCVNIGHCWPLIHYHKTVICFIFSIYFITYYGVQLYHIYFIKYIFFINLKIKTGPLWRHHEKMYLNDPLLFYAMKWLQILKKQIWWNKLRNSKTLQG